MSFTDIAYQVNDGVARITINRPETYNAVREHTKEELVIALKEAAHDDSVRVIVIAGAGPNAFSSGADLSEPEFEQRGDSDPAIDYFRMIRENPKPVIAMVDGFAIGSGNILAYACDFTIASDRSRFGQTGPRHGSPASGYLVGYLTQVVGQKKAREIWMRCRQYTAQQALEMGLVNSVVPVDELEAEVDQWCEDLKSCSPVILQLQKITFNEVSDPLKVSSPTERYAPDYLDSEESLERRTAFLERRKPDPAKNLPLRTIEGKTI